MEVKLDQRTAAIGAALHIMEHSTAPIGEKILISINVLGNADQDMISGQIITALKNLQVKSKTESA